MGHRSVGMRHECFPSKINSANRLSGGADEHGRGSHALSHPGAHLRELRAGCVQPLPGAAAQAVAGPGLGRQPAGHFVGQHLDWSVVGPAGAAAGVDRHLVAHLRRLSVDGVRFMEPLVSAVRAGAFCHRPDRGQCGGGARHRRGSASAAGSHALLRHSQCGAVYRLAGGAADRRVDLAIGRGSAFPAGRRRHLAVLGGACWSSCRKPASACIRIRPCCR